MKISTQLRVSAGSLAVGLALASSPAMAQGTDDGAEETDEVIVVTGSRINNPNLVTSSPVRALGEVEIDSRQVIDAESLIGELPGVGIGTSTSRNNGNGGFSTFNLRGLGSNRNLVLLDGQRIVPATLTAVTDLNNVPLALVERVDIVTGGASSVYGADAIAGVVNFITKDDFEGVAIDLTGGIDERGDGPRFRADVTVGGNFDEGRGNAVLSVGYQNTTGIFQGDREFGENTFFGSTPLGSGTSVPTRINGDQYDPTSASLVPTFNTFNYAPFNYLRAPFERFNMFGKAHYEVADGIEVYTNAMFSKNIVDLQLAPSGLFGDPFVLPLNNAFLPAAVRDSICADNGISAADCAAAGAATDPTDPNYIESTVIINRRLVEQGPRQTNNTTNTFQITVGTRGDITDDIQFDIFGQYGESDRQRARINWGLKSRVEQALQTLDANTCVDSSNGCVPLNLFGDGQSISQGAADFINAATFSTTKTTLASVIGSISGDLPVSSPFASTPIGFSVGAEYRRYTAGIASDVPESTQDEVLGTGAPSPNQFGDFDVAEAFVETIIPIVEDTPGFYSLSVELGARYSDYSTSGGSWTYKAGGSWEPIESLRVRGIYQRSVRSPNISELFAPITTGLSNLTVDPCQLTNPVGNAALTAICIAQGAPSSQIGSIPIPSAAQVNASSGGNPNLDVETADSYTLGFVFTPDFVPGLTIALDYYNITVTGAITTPSPDDLIVPCFGTTPFSNPPGGSTCSLIQRNPLNGSLNGGGETPGLLLNLTNQGRIESSGIDLEINYSLPTSFGGLSWTFIGNHTIDDNFQASPTSINRDCLGQFSSNCLGLYEYSFNLRTSAQVDGFGTLSLLWRWQDGYEFERITATSLSDEFTQIDPFSYFDLSANIPVNENFTFSFLVENLLDKQPPFTGSFVGPTGFNAGNTFPSNYDTLGRRFTATAGLRF